jgi:chorismate synthase
VEENLVRCPIPSVALEMENFIKEIKKSGDTVGGAITCVVRGVPAGWGEPVFDRLQAKLAQAMLGINAAKGFEYGSGFEAARMKGSEHNDTFIKDDKGNITTKTNFSGGIQGGISNGLPIYFKVAFKPIATILQPRESLNKDGDEVALEGKGRHDPCVVPRAVPIVEAMTALVLADFYLLSKLSKI